MNVTDEKVTQVVIQLFYLNNSGLMKIIAYTFVKLNCNYSLFFLVKVLNLKVKTTMIVEK